MRRELAACGLLLGCGADDVQDVGSDGRTSSTAASEVGITVLPTDGARFDLGMLDVGAVDCGLHNGDLGLSFIWIANSTQGTVSKIDTVSLAERGRYVVRPDAAGNPSRTSVNLSGDVAVANRNGGITKIYALPERCADSNGTPGIQTADGSEFLAWGVEECIAWYTPMTYVSQRPVAWTQGVFDPEACSFREQKLWTAGMNTPGTVDILRLDGDTGAIEAKVTIDDAYVDHYGIYGGAVDARGNFWGSQVGQAKLHFVDYETLEHKSWDLEVGAYGITVDSQGYVWTCSGNASRFDPVTETWQRVLAGEYGGCMEDGHGTLYKAAPGGIVAIDTATLAIKKTYALPQHIHGISVDFYGYVWGVSQGSEAYRLDPQGGSFETVGGLVGAYTYSDMTGFALSAVGVP
ncbi:hypothetical protein SAMN02745121_00021 [Nannocystis exedens]|uniref:Uncharacterized protein n=1 Tax=Nannocystis exedens TaxID=54 RepID=A0A1I1SGH6_9BACT|nr:hypothetical protein [Nannocystis exedens]PCC75481.1 hypothetical protein NAEX_08592 [Nannocystis exedens]SFD45604.1 hypothetical protein SAMN02745121_00021 [Nannocystis exedens]